MRILARPMARAAATHRIEPVRRARLAPSRDEDDAIGRRPPPRPEPSAAGPTLIDPETLNALAEARQGGVRADAALKREWRARYRAARARPAPACADVRA